MRAFSELLSSNEDKGYEHTFYIKSIISELLIDPQRQKNNYDSGGQHRGKEVSIQGALESLKELPSIIEKISESVEKK